MKCVHHPNAVIHFEEVTDYKKHPLSGELVRVHREMPVCPDCFVSYEETGIYKPSIKRCELDDLESKVESYIDSQIAERRTYASKK
tara:strand:- start:764 stop:1021 length:258 start_codon:yes stop_codon:yes gene_type:complete